MPKSRIYNIIYDFVYIILLVCPDIPLCVFRGYSQCWKFDYTDTWLILITALVLWLRHCVCAYPCVNGVQTTRVRRSRDEFVCVCTCVFARIQRACGGLATSTALVYVYTTYLEEFAGVLACICLTALTDPDPNISLEEPSVARAFCTLRVGAKTGSPFVLVNSRKTNPEFHDLPLKWSANAHYEINYLLCHLLVLFFSVRIETHYFAINLLKN